MYACEYFSLIKSFSFLNPHCALHNSITNIFMYVCIYSFVRSYIHMWRSTYAPNLRYHPGENICLLNYKTTTSLMKQWWRHNDNNRNIFVCSWRKQSLMHWRAEIWQLWEDSCKTTQMKRSNVLHIFSRNWMILSLGSASLHSVFCNGCCGPGFGLNTQWNHMYFLNRAWMKTISMLPV